MATLGQDLASDEARGSLKVYQVLRFPNDEASGYLAKFVKARGPQNGFLLHKPYIPFDLG
jgi:hypothetical protein